MKTCIVYYSMSGNTAMIAEKVSQKLHADLIPLTPAKAYPDKGFKKFIWGGKSALMGDKPKLEPYFFDSSKYDLVIFGSPVWASSFTPPIRTFIEENRAKLTGKRFAVFLCYSGGGAEKAIEKLRSFLSVDSFKAQLVLVDPKENFRDEDQKMISDFCDSLR